MTTPEQFDLQVYLQAAASTARSLYTQVNVVHNKKVLHRKKKQSILRLIQRIVALWSHYVCHSSALEGPYRTLLNDIRTYFRQQLFQCLTV
jgi:glycerol-3-phosphate cytidylyltransferase-like family protein